MHIGFKKLHPNAVIPSYAHQGDSGFDLYAIEDNRVDPGQVVGIRTGLAVQLPGPVTVTTPVGQYPITFTFELQVRPKSGLSLKKRLSVFNTPGTIDSVYTGEIIVLAYTNGSEPVYILAGDKIAQGVIAPVICAPHVFINEVYELTETSRGAGGFGSTGF